MHLYLASTSPARLAVLRSAGIAPAGLISPDLDEQECAKHEETKLGRDLKTSELVLLLAKAKAEAAYSKILDRETHLQRTSAQISIADSTVLHDSATPKNFFAEPSLANELTGLLFGGDSAFELAGVSYGKPHTASVARQRIQAQRGKTGTLYSGHWLIDMADGSGVGAVTSATVTMTEDFPDAEIDAYIATGEPLAVAGSFTVDSLGSAYIEQIVGDPSTVIGLSVPTLRKLVRELGYNWPDFWNLK